MLGFHSHGFVLAYVCSVKCVLAESSMVIKALDHQENAHWAKDK